MNRIDVCVVGLGYVGLTLAVGLAEQGFCVSGVEKRTDVVDLLRDAHPHFSEKNLPEALSRVLDQQRLFISGHIEPCSSAKIFIITVGTPLDTEGRFSTDNLIASTHDVASVMPAGSLVILRSTVAIGATRNIVMPILESSGVDFCLAMCPERTLEGAALSELRSLPQIVGGVDHKSTSVAAQFFRDFAKTVVCVESAETAEMIKLVDNTYRDVIFAFGNEVAIACDAFGVSAHEVIECGKLGYPRTAVAYPGPVGGPCLEKDPHILSQSAKKFGTSMPLTEAARALNETLPEYISHCVEKLLGRKSSGNIIIAGLAFKGIPETDDLRGTTALPIINCIKERLPMCHLTGFDPVCNVAILECAFKNLDRVERNFFDAIQNADILVIANNHPFFKSFDIEQVLSHMASSSVVFDCWNMYSSTLARSSRYVPLGSFSKVKQMNSL